MKFLFFKFPLLSSLGGGEIYTLGTAQNLVKQGFGVKLFTSDQYLLRLFEKAGLPRKRMFLGWEPTAVWSLLFWPVTYLIVRRKFKKLLKEIPGENVLILQSLVEKLILTPLILKSKILWLEHKIPGRWLKLNPLKHRYLKLARQVKIITVSNFAKQEFVKFGVLEKNIEVFYPTPASSLPVSPSRTGREKAFTIGILSRIDPEKGVLDFVKILLPALQKYSEWKILIAGEGEERKNLELLIKKHNLREQIKLLGFVSKHDLFFEQISVLAAPTRAQESFGMAVGEAAARGICVVATKIGALPEIIKHGQNGFLVEPLAKPELWIEGLNWAKNSKAVNYPINRPFSQTFTDFLQNLSFP